MNLPEPFSAQDRKLRPLLPASMTRMAAVALLVVCWPPLTSAAAPADFLRSANLDFAYSISHQRLEFRWNSIDGADHYRLSLDAAGDGEFKPVAGAGRLRRTSFSQSIRYWTADWTKAKYRLEACAKSGERCARQEIAVSANDFQQTISFTQSLGLRAGARFAGAQAISGDGATLAIGAPGARRSSGGVQILVWAENRWQSQAWLPSPDDDPGNQFGYSLALSAKGDTLVVGAPGEDSDPGSARSLWQRLFGADGADPADIDANNKMEDSGAVYVYRRQGGLWQPHSWLKASNADVADGFGHSVAIDAAGKTVAVGAPGEDGAAKSRRSYWKKALRFLAGTEEQGVGAVNVRQDLPQDNEAPDAGAVYVYRLEDAEWAEQIYIKASNTDPGDGFGHCAALSADGGTLFVGAPFEDSSLEDGHSFLTEALNFIADDPRLDTTRTTADDDIQTNNDANESGAVYVYVFVRGEWYLQAWLKASNTGAGDRFGCALSASADANTLAVGAPYEDSADYTGSSFWPPLKGQRSGLGRAAEAVGELDQDSNDAIDTGAVYLFRRQHGRWYPEAYIKPTDVADGNQFGAAIALSGDGRLLSSAAPAENGRPALKPTRWQSLASRLQKRFEGGLADQAETPALNYWRRLARRFLGSDGSAPSRPASHRPASVPGAVEDSGAVYVFKQDSGQWRQRARLASDWRYPHLRFGHSLATDTLAMRLVIGAPGHPLALRDGPAGAYVIVDDVGALYSY